MRRILLILMMMNVMSPFTYLKANNPDYVGDVNAEAQPICFDSEGIYTYPLNPNGYGYDEADVLNPNIDFDLKDGNDYNLIAPTWFYIEPTTPLGFSIKVTKTITSGEGTKIDYICFRVPKSADPLALTYATTGADNAISYDYEYNNEGYFTIDFPADPNEEYNYVLVTFNMWENYGDASPTGNYEFELVEPEIPTSIVARNFNISSSTICQGESFTLTGNQANPEGTNYYWEIRTGSYNGTIIGKIEGSPKTYTPDPSFTGILYIRVMASYSPGYICDSIHTSATNSMNGAKTIKVTAKPTADFSHGETLCPGKEIEFTNNSTNATSYTWNFGDGGTSDDENPKHTFGTAGTYNVTLTATNGTCSDVITKTVTIKGIDVDFSYDPNPGKPGEVVEFTITNYNSDYTYTWECPSAFTGSQEINSDTWTHTFDAIGNYNVTLTATHNGCDGNATKTVVISNCDHSAEFTIEPNPTCYGENFTCTVDNPVPGAIYEWSLSDETFPDEKAPTWVQSIHTPGTHTITLQMTVLTDDGSCTVRHSEDVTILPKKSIESISAINPDNGKTVASSSSSGTICQWNPCRSKLQFNYTTSAGTTIEPTDDFLWDFGDGTTSTERNPEHGFETTGTKVVTLTVTTANGCTSEPKKLTINVTPVADAEFIMTKPACEGESAVFEILNPVSGAYYEWWSGDVTNECENVQQIANAEGTDKTTFEASGSGTISVIARARSSQYADCFDTHSMEVTFDSPIVTIVASESVCFGSGTVTFTALSDVEDVTYEWTVNGEPYTYENDNMIEFSEVGLYEVSVVAKSGDGCESDPSGIVSAEVYEKPFVFLDKLADSLCYGGGYLTFVARSEGAYEYIWTVNGEAYHETDSEIEFSEVGEYNVSVSAVSENGCESDPSENTATIFDYFQIRVCNDTTIGNNSTANLYAINGNSVDTSKYSFCWEPAELVVNPDALVTETVMLTETTTFILRATNKICGECSSFDDVLVEVMSATPVEFVDLGLSVKWASQNVEASSVENSGEYFLCAQLPDLSFPNVGRLPTKEEMHELKDLCEWKWTTQNGVNGYLVTSKTNGNSIFIPAAGYYYHRDVFRDNEVGNYWTSTSSDSINYYLFISNRAHSVDWNKIDYGRNIRLVTE